MKPLLLISLTLIFLFGCKQLGIDIFCQKVSEITTSPECYNPAAGLTLTAPELRKKAKMEWVIAPLKDSLGGTTYIPYRETSNTNSITIPDSVIKGFPLFSVVYVSSGACNSDLEFRFALRPTTDSTCSRWEFLEAITQGD